MSEKAKLITKQDTPEYETTRKRAQKISFAKLQEIMMRNVSKTSTKTYAQYTKDLLKQYLLNPSSNINTIREVSRFLERNSMIYKKLIRYQATLPLYLYSVTQLNTLLKPIDETKSLKKYEEVLLALNGFRMKKDFCSSTATCIRDGMSVGFAYPDKENTFLMPLDIQYCRIFGKTQEGEWIVYFDASYFDKGNNVDFVRGIDGDTSACWDAVFINGYEQFKTGGNTYQWFQLPPERTLCLFCGGDDDFAIALPEYTPLFISLLDLIDLEQIIMSKTELENYILLISKIPLHDNSQELDDFSISLELVQQFNEMLAQAVPELVGVAYSPMEIDTVKFDKSNSSDDTDKLSRSMSNLFNNAGISQLVVAGGASTNSVGLNHAIENDIANTWCYVNRIESWMNYFIKMNISEGYSFRIHQITWYNRDSYIKNMKEAATLGGSALDYFVCVSNKTPYEVINEARFNATVLKLNQWLTPLSSTYTQTNNTGAPTKSDTEITSEETLKTRDGNKNGNTTSTVN